MINYSISNLKWLILSNLDDYICILSRHYGDPITLIQSAIKDEYHLLWHICKDCAIKNMSSNSSWYWLATRIDDFSLLATQYMCKRLPVWIWKSHFLLGSICNVLDDTGKTIRWLINRWISSIKNLFDARYSYHILPFFTISFEETYMTKEIQWGN
jgi:hypothetical protein